MGETLGIAHNVFEKMEREKDRKERLKKYEEWVKEQEKRKLRLRDMQARLVGQRFSCGLRGCIAHLLLAQQPRVRFSAFPTIFLLVFLRLIHGTA